MQGVFGLAAITFAESNEIDCLPNFYNQDNCESTVLKKLQYSLHIRKDYFANTFEIRYDIENNIQVASLNINKQFCQRQIAIHPILHTNILAIQYATVL